MADEPPDHSAATFTTRAIGVLRRKYPGLIEGPGLIPGLAMSYSAAFTGVYRDDLRLWLVATWPDLSVYTSGPINNLTTSVQGIFAAFGDRQHNTLNTGALIVTRASSSVDNYRTKLASIHLQVEIIALEQLEAEIIADDSARYYPGATAEIGHNSREYRQALGTIDGVIEELSSSNSLELHADTRNRLLVEVQAGRTLLEARVVRADAVKATLVPALTYLADAFAKASIGELATHALTALAKLLPHFFG